MRAKREGAEVERGKERMRKRKREREKAKSVHVVNATKRVLLALLSHDFLSMFVRNLYVPNNKYVGGRVKSPPSTLNVVYNVTNSSCLAQILVIVNCPCGVTKHYIACKPNIICRSL